MTIAMLKRLLFKFTFIKSIRFQEYFTVLGLKTEGGLTGIHKTHKKEQSTT